MGNPVPDPAAAAPPVIVPPPAAAARRWLPWLPVPALAAHLPAWMASGVVHVALVGTLVGVDRLIPRPAPAPASDAQLTVVADDRPAADNQPDLTNDTLGLDSELPAAAQNDNLQGVNVDTGLVTPDPPGVAEATAADPADVVPPPGVAAADLLTPGAAGDAGNLMPGFGAGAGGLVANPGFAGRSAATRSKLVAAGGGNARSEAAVAQGTVWLAKQQKADGGWEFDGDSKDDRVAATGMALLPFLAAGQTHKASKDNKYTKTVAAGLAFLLKRQKADGSFAGVEKAYMYSHAIAAVALCEALGMTGDRALLLAPAQRAVNYILAGQGADGSWGYSAGTTGDVSIVGWQVQALRSAQMCKDLVVDPRALDRARGFLSKMAYGPGKSRFGYSLARPDHRNPTLDAVGLLCRYYLDGWGPANPGMAAGVAHLAADRPPDPAKWDSYYYYYATQVVHFFGGPEWQAWNARMRDLLVDRQVPAAGGPAAAGTWPPDANPDPNMRDPISRHCGRLGTTCMALLTLEVYYRHLPLYKRDATGLKELERVR